MTDKEKYIRSCIDSPWILTNCDILRSIFNHLLDEINELKKKLSQTLNFPTVSRSVEEQEAKLGPIPPVKGSVTLLGPLSDDLPALDHDPAGLPAMQDFKIRDRPHNPGE